MNHYVYRIDRPSTGEWYVGIRSCKCAPLEDVGYMGSGTRVRSSVRKHGRDQFTKTILAQVQTRKEAARIERGLVGPDQVADELCLNLCEGGGIGSLGVTRSEEHRQRISEAQSGRPRSAKHRKAVADAKRGVKLGPASAARKQRVSDALLGHEVSEETRRRISKSKSGKPWSEARWAAHRARKKSS